MVQKRRNADEKIAIIGSGPTGIYTFYSLLNNAAPLSITVFEKADQPGVGMPYSDEDNSRLMLANIASIEIPPIFITYPTGSNSRMRPALPAITSTVRSCTTGNFCPVFCWVNISTTGFSLSLPRRKRLGFISRFTPTQKSLILRLMQTAWPFQ